MKVEEYGPAWDTINNSIKKREHELYLRRKRATEKLLLSKNLSFSSFAKKCKYLDENCRGMLYPRCNNPYTDVIVKGDPWASCTVEKCALISSLEKIGKWKIKYEGRKC